MPMKLGTIALPLVDSDASLDDALAMMREASRSGLVWRRSPNEFVLYTAARVVLQKREHDARFLHDLVGQAIVAPDIGKVADATPNSFLAWETLISTLPSLHPAYGLLAANVAGDSMSALLFTTDEDALVKLEPAPADCFCPQCDRGGPRGSKCPIHAVLLVCGS